MFIRRDRFHFLSMVLSRETAGTVSAFNVKWHGWLNTHALWIFKYSDSTVFRSSCVVSIWCGSWWNWADAHCGWIVLWCTGLKVYPSSNRWHHCAFKSWVKWWRSRCLGWRFEITKSRNTLRRLQNFFFSNAAVLPGYRVWCWYVIGQLSSHLPLSHNECDESTPVWTPGK